MTQTDKAPVILREFCAENLTHLDVAIAAGAGRIELCDNLARGGTTPSVGVVARAVELAHARGVAVRVIIRPRGGDFCYTDGELSAMERDIEAALALGADGIVFGCLAPHEARSHGRAREAALLTGRLPGDPMPGGYTGGYGLDEAACARLMARACAAASRRGEPFGATFHMAFDALDRADQSTGIDAIADLGFDRILTHGGPAGTPIEDNLGRLSLFVKRASGQISILPGGGITYNNAEAVANALGVGEVHGTRVVALTAGAR